MVRRPRAIIAALIVVALIPLAMLGGATNTAAADVAVGINGFAFMPATITVPVGTRVVWTNQQPQASHTVTSDTPGIPDSGALQTGATFAFVFNQAGTFAYHCNIHPFMHGTVVVTAAGTTATATAAPATAARCPAADGRTATDTIGRGTGSATTDRRGRDDQRSLHPPPRRRIANRSGVGILS